MEEFKSMLDSKTVRMIQDDTLEFIKTNMNHLPMYYIPQREFEWKIKPIIGHYEFKPIKQKS